MNSFLAALLGGAVVLAAGAALIVTDVIDTGETTREVVRQAPVTRPAGGEGEGRTVSEIYRQEGQGVVFVEARGGSDAPSIFGIPRDEGTATGSGFLIDDEGTILTNAHVVQGAERVGVRFREDGELIDADVRGRDPSTDLAVLKIDKDEAKARPLPLGSSGSVQVGDPVIAIGNPFGFTRTVTTGIVSAKQRQITAPNGFPIRNVLQTDASVNPGNSGGPLLDADGRVIGINSQIATGGSSGSVGIAFAVPIDTAKRLLPDLREGERIERAYLGIEMADVTDQVARDLNLPARDGALITEVVPGGPADDAGLRGGRTPTGEGIAAGGDLIVRVDGRAVRGPDDVATAIEDDRPGETVEIEFFRGDERRRARVKLGRRPNAVVDPAAPEGGGLIP